MTDRRRNNPPPGGTTAPVFASVPSKRALRSRDPDQPRKVFLKTGVVPSASGSAYLETQPSLSQNTPATLTPTTSSLKVTCTVHGPRPLPRNAAFSPNLLLSTHVKFAPFATKQRRGYVRDASERDLGVHLETALRGVVIGERWPKAGCEVVVTVLEGEEDGDGSGWGMMSVLAGCVTVASAALVDAGIDCVDLVSGGVAALVLHEDTSLNGTAGHVVLDPAMREHEVKAACVVGYLQSRDEVTEVWVRGSAGWAGEMLVDRAVEAAGLMRGVLAEAVREAVELKVNDLEDEKGLSGAANGAVKKNAGKGKAQDVVMTG